MYCPFDTGAEFASHLRSLRERFAKGDRTVLGKLVGIFAPTGAWDDGIGEPMELANRIMELLKELDWQNP
jgi:hypothetical protein